eukprot:scaffold166124_cov17-Tisochrysis_lutea.AAC.1
MSFIDVSTTSGSTIGTSLEIWNWLWGGHVCSLDRERSGQREGQMPLRLLKRVQDLRQGWLLTPRVAVAGG